ncbi:class IIb bacteriocin, lactobin A/cerein 7B family [Pseudoxanthomonas taiwanensis]|jgi:class IIb bacteriocin, lactobin A/cerein 7B family|uniref:class IIb bacteriocin, lactobin A/cerein 7B family n=1 Tax=Pseudoxanthomonas taiwanensis TaxID=176598 RepID=UPI0013893F6A|nr:class IIb bacteriocin, lactobin A/cerein 7B family [Pseudoxanthomonas taiwanensis]
MVDLTLEEIEQVSGGVAPLIPVAIAFGKGFVAGVGVAAAVHVAVEAFELLTS